jgi:myo-inositol-1(or 4)-monophosphatase
LFSTNEELQISEKAPLDFVSSHDLEMSNITVHCIKKYFGDEQVLCEENFPDFFEISSGSNFWIIDPIDGTSNYISNIGIWALSLARYVNGQLVFGAVCDLSSNEIFSAQRGKGAFLNGVRIRNNVAKASLFAASTGFMAQYPEVLSDILNPEPLVKIRNFGCQSLHLAYVADGRLRGSISMESRVWDDCAGAIIIEESGGCFLSLAGTNIWKIHSIGRHALSMGLAFSDPSDDLLTIFRSKI